MSARKEIERLIQKKQQEIADLKRQTEHAETYIQALQDTLKRIPIDPMDGHGTQPTLRAGTDLWHVQDIIRKAGRPLHIDQIIPELSKVTGKQYTGTKRNGLIGSLGKYARTGKVFTRPGGNIFGIIEINMAVMPGVGAPDEVAENNT